MNIPVYNCLIDENTEDQSGIYAISFVDVPANEIDFVTLAKQPKLEWLNRDSKKQILTGVVLRPDQLIYRNDPRGEYYIRFSAEEIEKIAQKMMRTGIALQNTTHQHQNPLEGNFLTELWIVENPQHDKSQALGFADLPKGTLMCSYKIADKHYWDTQVMTGNVRGFSLEGFFFQEISNNKTIKSITNQKQNEKMNQRNKKTGTLFSRISQFFLDIQAVEKADSTSSGTAYVLFTLADGKEVYIDADGFATLDDEQLPAGDHPLADGNILVVDDQGQFIETKEAATTTSNPSQTTAPEILKRVNRHQLEDQIVPQPEDEESTDGESTEILKQKIADLEAKLAELANLAKEANTEVQKLRSQTPSSMPATAMATCRRMSEMKRYEQMAQALSMTIRNRG
uniref:XkdF-like putative serine protease domain-containing protein n=1 Tax=uncultured Dysgonomonas sp. TaxID=206096 RepID=UPI00262E69E9|nr:XkdF-like putative serine protease domain-containing protein [uncultured Dysgonomonas sp.]